MVKRIFNVHSGLLAFWVVWWLAVVVKNFTDLLKVWGLLPADFDFVSNNYAIVVGGSGLEGVGRSIFEGVYLLGFAWQLAIVALTVRALVILDPARRRPAAHLALGLNAAFWAAFMILVELAMSKTPSLYIELFTAALVSLGLFYLPIGGPVTEPEA